MLNRILMLLWPWAEIKRQREANERLIQAMTDPLLTGIRIGNGSIDIGISDSVGAELIAGVFLGVFEKYPDAENYMEWRFQSKLGPVVVTAIKPGGKSPDQLRREAEQELADLRAKLSA